MMAQEMAPLPKGRGAVSKVSKFGWQPVDVAARGSYRLLDKSQIFVADEYQRPAANAKALEIAATWSWPACGTISVALREGRFYAFDGQHRVLAAQKRSDIQDLPCMVYAFDGDIRKEARGFLDINTGRKPVTWVTKYNAALLAGNASASRVSELLRAADRRPDVVATDRTISCLGRLMELVDSPLSAALHTIWPILIAASTGRPLREKVVAGVTLLEYKMPDGESLEDSRYSQRLISLGVDELDRAATKMAAIETKGGSRVWASGILSILNKGRQKRLLVDGLLS